MKKIFKLISKATLIFIISSTLVFSSFAFPVKKAEAGAGLGNFATELTQKINSVFEGTTAGATAGNFLKENVLDGIGWAIAKQMVSSMTQSLVNWINSGFQGSPAFITDFNGFLLDALDSVAGEYIKSLGGIGEFICSPFKLDVQAALSINYAQARSGMPSGPTACTVTGIKDNIENFMQGTMSGWDQWLKVTSNPQNTPYGAYLEAQSKLNIRLINEAGQQKEIANWGDGFLSKKICEGINGASSGSGKCTITTPGKVISEALTFQLSTGPRTLIEADEINEIIGALINQLTLQAMQGISGLLGLSGGTGYTDYSYDDGSGASSTEPYIDAAVNQSNGLSSDLTRTGLSQSLEIEQSFLTLIDSTIATANNKLIAMGATTTSTSTPTSTVVIDGLVTGTDSSSTSTPITITVGEDITPTASESILYELISEANSYKTQVTANIFDLNVLISDYDNASINANSTQTATDIQQEVATQYLELVNSAKLTSAFVLETKRVEWGQILQ